MADEVNFGGGVSPVSQLGTVTPGSVAVFVAEGIIAKGTGGEIGVFPEAPTDGRDYLRNGATESWVPLHITAEVGEAPAAPLGSLWVRQGSTQSWQPAFTQTAADTRYAPISTVSFPEAPPGGPYGRQPGAWVAVAPLLSPNFTGTPSAPTPPALDSSTRLATTAFVANAVSALGSGTVTSITAGTGLTGGTITTSGTIALDPATALTAIGGAPVASPALSGVPTAPTATAGTDTTQIATTAFVKAAVDAIDALPTGGAQYDVLSKASATDGDVEWRGAGERPNANTVIGAGAYAARTTGFNSVAIGTDAMAASTAANFSVAVGHSALTSNVASTQNTAIGYYTLRVYNSAGAGQNTAVGTNAFNALTSGIQNIALGSASGGVASATESIFIGASARGAADNQSNQIAIGSGAVGNGSNTITLGNDNITALYTHAGLVLGDNPTGGSKGPGTINLTDGIFINNQPVGFAQTVTWVAGMNPHQATLFTNSTGRELTILRVLGQREVMNSTAATVNVYSADPDTDITLGTLVSVAASLDVGGVSPGQIGNMTSGSLTLLPGHRLGLVATGVFDLSVASITVYLA